MPATPDRIAFVRAQYRIALAGPDAGVVSRYGATARDTGDEPVPTFFEDVADAQILAEERLALLSKDRRRFRHELPGIKALPDDLDFSQTTPGAQVIDTERRADHLAAIVEISMDFENNKTGFTTWGGTGEDLLLSDGPDPLEFGDDLLKVD